MARYQYTGPGPQVTPNVGSFTGAILRPGDICEFDEEPAFGPWELLDGPDAPAPDTAPPPAQLPPLGAPVTPEGM